MKVSKMSLEALKWKELKRTYDDFNGRVPYETIIHMKVIDDEKR